MGELVLLPEVGIFVSHVRNRGNFEYPLDHFPRIVQLIIQANDPMGMHGLHP